MDTVYVLRELLHVMHGDPIHLGVLRELLHVVHGDPIHLGVLRELLHLMHGDPIHVYACMGHITTTT